jgi:hypothetical protein
MHGFHSGASPRDSTADERRTPDVRRSLWSPRCRGLPVAGAFLGFLGYGELAGVQRGQSFQVSHAVRRVQRRPSTKAHHIRSKTLPRPGRIGFVRPKPCFGPAGPILRQGPPRMFSFILFFIFRQVFYVGPGFLQTLSGLSPRSSRVSQLGDLWMWLQLVWLQFGVVRSGSSVVDLGPGLGLFAPQAGPTSTPNDPDQTSDILNLQPHDLAVLKMIFVFFTGPGGPGGGSGLPFSKGHRRFWADSGPNPGIFNFYFGPKHSVGSSRVSQRLALLGR